ncbi:uncharacterized protein B0T15DRAFT_562740 [Chaetomium strumarium]|uniref:ribonuclease H n=1 Tax=Chaetomium strumarium TaxID=1170767 RepID=A0AAJ0GML3_9PEZI|nr:hypothetical protein B0T15DRAFT_562740 [Chaetomium strumarium]
MSPKFYAVRRGRVTGIFTTWEEARPQVDGFSRNEHQAFRNLKDAEAYLHQNVTSDSHVMMATPNIRKPHHYIHARGLDKSGGVDIVDTCGLASPVVGADAAKKVAWRRSGKRLVRIDDS